jgi:hypothetical protein
MRKHMKMAQLFAAQRVPLAALVEPGGIELSNPSPMMTTSAGRFETPL